MTKWTNSSNKPNCDSDEKLPKSKLKNEPKRKDLEGKR